MKNRITTGAALIVLLLLMTSCGGGSSANNSSSTSTTSQPSATGSVNTWIGPPADTTKLPIGTQYVSSQKVERNGLYICESGPSRGGRALPAGPWANEAAGTWDLSKKLAVNGSVSWPMATYEETISGNTRVIKSNGLPVGQVTGVFPIAANDPAYAYDRNPNRIAANTISVSLPVNPVIADKPSCVGKGSIGILKNGVSLFAPIDELNRDAVVYETQDKCNGHPQQTSLYHYHDIPSCIRDASVGSSTVVGFAADGFPIVVERDADGNLPTNKDLDECHGRVSLITLDGKPVEMYHYSATYEFPYFIGCFKGTPR